MNKPLTEYGLDPLTEVQVAAFNQYWWSFIDSLQKMTQEELDHISQFSRRVSEDANFTNWWLLAMKRLFDIEDTSGDGDLQRGEFENFMQQVKNVTVFTDRLGDEVSVEKTEISWAAMTALSGNSEEVDWQAFMLSQQIMQIWFESEMLLEDLEAVGALDRFCEVGK